MLSHIALFEKELVYMGSLPANHQNEISLTQVRRIQLEILDSIHAFCQEKGLRYAMAYGTLIGAVRHGGYIPWDDDIDIMMPRPDYDIFIKSYQSEENRVIDLAESPVCVEMFAKISRVGTYMEDVYGRVLWGVNVDVFPIDGYPSPGNEATVNQLFHLNGLTPVVCPFYRAVRKNKPIWFFKYAVKRVLHPSIPNVLDLKMSISTRLREQSFEEASYAGAYFGDAGLNEFMEKEIFCSFTQVKFEGNCYPAPAQYDIYLRNLYGDYMTLPPEDQRVLRHCYKYYSI